MKLNEDRSQHTQAHTTQLHINAGEFMMQHWWVDGTIYSIQTLPTFVTTNRGQCTHNTMLILKQNGMDSE